MWRNDCTGTWDTALKICQKGQKNTRKILTKVEKEITKLIKKYIPKEAIPGKYAGDPLIIIQPSGFSARKILDVPVKYRIEGKDDVIKFQQLAIDDTMGVRLLSHKYNLLQRIFIFAPESIRYAINKLKERNITEYNKLNNGIQNATYKELGVQVSLFPKE
jgi:hypothetical protein